MLNTENLVLDVIYTSSKLTYSPFVNFHFLLVLCSLQLLAVGPTYYIFTVFLKQICNS